MKGFSADQAKEFEETVSRVYQSVEVINARVGGKVIGFSDEWFAAASNLLTATPPVRDATRFTYAGAWYDGWETRRHNTEEYDWVIIKAGVYGARVIGCEVDTAFFTGNNAPEISVEGLLDLDENSEENVLETDDRWSTVIEKSECGPSQRQFFLRDNLTDAHYNYFKLKMYPDGGIARFRLYGKVVPPPLNKGGELQGKTDASIDLCNVVNGAVPLAVSDQHFGSANNLIMPGRGHDMSDGWETKRSREPGHVDWAILQLGRKTNYVEKIVVDTAHFRGNFPQYITVHGITVDSEESPAFDDPKWITLVEKSKTGPDKEHEYVVNKDIGITHVKLTIIPDGGVKRVRVFGI